MGMAYALVAAAAILFATREAAILDAVATFLGNVQGVIGAVALVIVALVVMAAVHPLAAYGIVNRRNWARWLGISLSLADLCAGSLVLLAQFALERPLGTALIAAIVVLLNGLAAYALLTASDEFSASTREPTLEQ